MIFSLLAVGHRCKHAGKTGIYNFVIVFAPSDHFSKNWTEIWE